MTWLHAAAAVDLTPAVLVALITACVTGGIAIFKFPKDRDAIVVSTAQGALLVTTGVIETLQADLARVRAELDALRAERDTLRRELHAMTDRAEALEDRVAELEDAAADRTPRS